MPTYQYACTTCGEQLEVVQKFTDDPLTVCPACEGQLRKVFSPVGVVFKGSGFYRTDSRVSANGGSKSGKSTETGDSGASKTESGATSTGSSEATSNSGSSNGAKSASGPSSTSSSSTAASTTAA